MTGRLGLSDGGVARLCGAIGVACFVAAVAVIVAQARTRPLDLDEQWYLNTVPQFRELGWSTAFLRALPGPAGPLYTWVHAAFEPATGLRPLGTRLVTAGLAGATTLMLAAVLALRGVAFAGWRAWEWVPIPFVVSAFTLAYTEMPAMLLFYGQLALLLWLLRRAPTHPGQAAGAAVVAGLLLGLAILGRQQLTAALVLAPLLGMRRRATWPALAVYVVAGAILPAVVFRAWGGIVPPKTQYIQAGLVVGNGLIALGYAAVAYAIWDMSWATRRNLAILAGIVAVMAVANLGLDLKTAGVPLRPGIRYVEKLASPAGAEAYVKMVRGVVVGFSVAFLAFLAHQAWRYRRDPEMLVFLALVVLLPLSTMRVTHTFTPRYAVPILPLLLLLACERGQDTVGRAARLGVFGAFGVLRVFMGRVY